MQRLSRATLYRRVESGLMKPLKLDGKVLFSESELNQAIQRMKKKS
jgi:predicted DNA-binding transcriptional regulator AlpA